jgi:hypothetical protein
MAAEATAMDGTKSKRKGGLRTMPYIFGKQINHIISCKVQYFVIICLLKLSVVARAAANEVAEKLAVVGFSTNMLIYLTQQMHMPLAKAATTLTNFGGTSAMTPLIGAYLADAVIGRFWTIAGASLVYQVVSTHIDTHTNRSIRKR